MPADLDDSERLPLVRRAQDGDREAFADIYRADRDYVWGYCYRRVKCRWVADDLASQVWLRVWRNISRYEPHGPWRAWLSTVCRNTVVDHFKKIDVRLSTPVGDAGVMDSADDDPSANPERAAIDRIMAEELWRLVPLLEDRQALVLWWRFHDGLSVAEAAARLDGGVSPAALKAVQGRAVTALARLARVA